MKISTILKSNYYRKKWKGLNIKRITKYTSGADKDIFDGKNIKDSLAVNQQNISYYFFSGGTTGNPKTIPFTNKEWINRAIYRKKCYEMIGLSKKNRVAILLPFGPWVAGPSVQSALSELKCTYFPIGLLKGEEEVLGFFEIIKKHNIDTIITMPSFMELLIRIYISPNNKIKFKLKNVITSGEYFSPNLKKEIRNLFAAKTYSSYASSEIFVGVECKKDNYYHYLPKKVGITVKKNKKTDSSGLLLFTNKISEAIPIINYSLGDLGFLNSSICDCGINWPRVCLTGRLGNIFNVAGGVNVHQYQIKKALLSLKVPIIMCNIIITNKLYGVDKIKFELSIKNNKRINKKIKNKFIRVLTNMSLDFSDVIFCGQVEISVILKKTREDSNGLKLEIKDERIYER